MRIRTRGRTIAFAAMLTVAVAQSAVAEESLSDSIEAFLNDVEEHVKNAKIGPVQVKPSMRQSIIWTDNIFLNDSGETNLKLTGVFGPSGNEIKDPKVLRQIEKNNPAFDSGKNEGRVDDGIWQSELNVGFSMPVNEEFTKAFKTDSMKLLTAKVKNQNYFSEHDLDNTSFELSADLFAFLGQFLQFDMGNQFWVRARGYHTKIKDPLDASIRLVNESGIGVADSFVDFERTETRANFDFGWQGNKTDAQIGYEYYGLRLKDDSLEQAEHDEDSFTLEVGHEFPQLREKRVFVSVEYSDYDFKDAKRATAGGGVTKEQILNNADVWDYRAGIEGPAFSRRIHARVDAGYQHWAADNDGLSGDNNSFSGLVGSFMVGYKPWEDKPTNIQLEYERSTGYSAISNYNAVHDVSLTYMDELIPRKLDLDATIGFNRTEPSDGPKRNLYEGGAGLTYHLFKQVDVTFRYVMRVQSSDDEIILNSAFVQSGTLFLYEQASNGDFNQNILELGIELNF